MNSGGDALATQGAIPGKANSTPEMEDCAILGGHTSFLIGSRRCSPWRKDSRQPQNRGFRCQTAQTVS